VPEAARPPAGQEPGGAEGHAVQIEERSLPHPGAELRSTLDSLSRTFDLPWYGLLERSSALVVDRPTLEDKQSEATSLMQLPASGAPQAVSGRHNPWDEVLNKQGYGMLRPTTQLQPSVWSVSLVFLVLALLVLLAAGAVVIPMPSNSKAEHLQVNGYRKLSGRWRSQFVQVALPFWMTTTPASTGAGGAALFCSLLVSTASLNFWLGYAALSLIRWCDPDTAAAIDETKFFGNQSLQTIAAIGVALAPTCFLPFQRQLATRKRQWLLLALKMLLLFEGQGVKLVGTYLARIQMNNIIALNADSFWHITWTLQLALLVIGCLDAFVGSYVESMLLLEWRKDLSQYMLKRYMGAQAYYKMNSNSGKDNTVDNPDQRIQEDTLTFVTELNNFTFSVISAVVTLVSSSVLIWTVVPQVTMMLVFYTFAGSLVSLWFIRSIAEINYRISSKEANYRHSLVHVRDNAESIALLAGDRQVEADVNAFFADLMQARKEKISWEMAFSSFSFAFTAGGTIVPCVMLAQLFFQMRLDVGVVAQVGLNLARVVACFSFINNSSHTMANLASAANRMTGLLRKVDAFASQDKVSRFTTADHEVRISALAVRTPDDRTLVENLDLKLGGEDGPARLVVIGKSGVGKSSLLRTLAGLWNQGHGKVGMPDRSTIAFLPQRPYMGLGSLRSQVCYPECEARASDDELLDLLGKVGLGDLAGRFKDGLNAVCDWGRVLSLGEQQRLAAARCLFTRPKMIVMDEATSALTVVDEGMIYSHFVALKMSFISVTIRDSAVKYHEKVLKLGEAPTDWQVGTSAAHLAAYETSAAPSEWKGPRRTVTLVVRDQHGHDANFKVYADSSLRRLMQLYCAEKDADTSQIAFHALGKVLQQEATPEELGLEDMTIIRAMPCAEQQDEQQ